MNVEQIETGARCALPFDPLRVFDELAEHLIAGADAEHAPAAAYVRLQVDVPALRAEELEVGDRRLAAGQDDEVRIERQRPTRRDEFELHLRLEPQRVEVVEVRDVRHVRDRDPNARAFARVASAGMLQLHGIFRRQRSSRMQPRHDAERRPAGARFDRVDAGAEQLHVAAKLVDDEAANALAILRIEHRMCADQRRNHVTAIDIADEHDRHVGRVRESHVGDVVRAQVGFRRAARAFDDDDVGFALQSAKAVERDLQQVASIARERVRVLRLDAPAAHDELRGRCPICGLSSTGFMSTVGGVRQANACSAVERPISPPSAVTAALFDMFCGLKGRTILPRFVSSRHSPATSSDLPTSEPQP